MSYSPAMYGDYVYPWWGEMLGWFMAATSIICIPIWMVFYLVKSYKSPFLQVTLHIYLQITANLKKAPTSTLAIRSSVAEWSRALDNSLKTEHAP